MLLLSWKWSLQWVLCVLEGLWVSFVRLVDSFCSLDRRVHLVFLNAGCCQSLSDPAACLVLLLLFASVRGCVCVCAFGFVRFP